MNTNRGNVVKNVISNALSTHLIKATHTLLVGKDTKSGDVRYVEITGVVVGNGIMEQETMIGGITSAPI